MNINKNFRKKYNIISILIFIVHDFNIDIKHFLKIKECYKRYDYILIYMPEITSDDIPCNLINAIWNYNFLKSGINDYLQKVFYCIGKCCDLNGLKIDNEKYLISLYNFAIKRALYLINSRKNNNEPQILINFLQTYNSKNKNNIPDNNCVDSNNNLRPCSDIEKEIIRVSELTSGLTITVKFTDVSYKFLDIPDVLNEFENENDLKKCLKNEINNIKICAQDIFIEYNPNISHLSLKECNHLESNFLNQLYKFYSKKIQNN
jgi:hypothetical protein